MTDPISGAGSKVNVTPEEMKRFQESFKDKEFRKLFFDYMNELQDPANKEIYERELAMLEAEKGNDVRYIKPVGVYVIKTFTNSDKAAVKVFINMCSSTEIECASPQASSANTSSSGRHWNIPYSLASPRDDVDHANKPCQVYDCVFHPDTHKIRSRIPAFSKLLETTAIEGIEKQFNIKLKREYKVIQMKCKGVPEMTMIRSKRETSNEPLKETSVEYIEKIQKKQQKDLGKAMQQIPKVSTQKTPIIPIYTIVHQQLFTDYQKFTSERERREGTRPDGIIVRISLPGVTSATEANLQVEPKTLSLTVENKYRLHIDLPFPVFSDKGNAKFDKNKHDLIVTLPVVPSPRQIITSDTSLSVETEGSSPDELCNGDLNQDNPLISVIEKEVEVVTSANDCTISPNLCEEVAEQPAEPNQDTAEFSTSSIEHVEQEEELTIPTLALPVVGSNSEENPIVSVDQLLEKLQISDETPQIPPFHITQSVVHASVIVDVADICQNTLDISVESSKICLYFKDKSGSSWRLNLILETPIDISQTNPFDISSQNGVLLVYKSSPGIWNTISIVQPNGVAIPKMLDTLNSFIGGNMDVPDVTASDTTKPEPDHVVTAHRLKDTVVVDIVRRKTPSPLETNVEGADLNSTLPTNEAATDSVQPGGPPQQSQPPVMAPLDTSPPTHTPVKLNNSLLYDLD